MSNSISRRTFLKCTGASVAALGAASLLSGCQQNGNATIVDVKVGDKVSNWNGLGVQLTSLFNIDTVPAQAGNMNTLLFWSPWSTAPRTRPSTSAHRIWPRSTLLIPCPRRRTWMQTSMHWQQLLPISLLPATARAWSAVPTSRCTTPTLRPSRIPPICPPAGYRLSAADADGPQGLAAAERIPMPTFAADKTMTFVMTAADVTRA